MVTCKACGGTYESVLTDGTIYFHRCPPLSSAELAAAVAKGLIVLPLLETPDVAVSRRTYERANLRDENLQATLGAGSAAIKREGLGTKPAATPAPGPVVVNVGPVAP
jgi:hypothetical protein